MHIVLVNIHVEQGQLEGFIAATLENAKNSLQEAGVLRFDVLQQAEDPARFVLVEVYRSPDDHLRHRETRHYQVWRDAVSTMMAEPRLGVKYINLFPEDEAWQK